MTVLFAVNVTGPDPLRNEIIDLGAGFYSPDFRTCHGTFRSAVRPLRPDLATDDALRLLGVGSHEELRQRVDQWPEPHKVWVSFLRTLMRHDSYYAPPPEGEHVTAKERAMAATAELGLRGQGLAEVATRTTFISAHTLADFAYLAAALQEYANGGPIWGAPRVTSLSSMTVDYATAMGYIGFVKRPRLGFEELLHFHGAKCKRVDDTLRRTQAAARAITNHFTNTEKIYAAAAKWHGANRYR